MQREYIYRPAQLFIFRIITHTIRVLLYRRINTHFMKPTFTVTEALGFGWEKTKKHFVTLLVIGVCALLISWIPEVFVTMSKEMPAGRFAFSIIGWIVQILVSIAIIKALLMISQDAIPRGKELIATADTALNFFLGSVLYGLIVAAGLILLIVPGIIWAIKYKFYTYLIVDKKMNALEALKKSGQITYGEKWNIFVFILACLLITLLGALALGIGLIVALPVVALAEVHVYRKLLNA